jgi:hypothetical protein
MKIEVTRKLEYADRLAVQQADQAIRKDVVRALVELVTNVDDSYHRLEDAGTTTTGRIIIEVQRRYSDSLLRVRDNAEGLTGDDMDVKVGHYGEATSGFQEGRSVRGLWGRGLKDAFFGLGRGSVASIRDGLFDRCSLAIKNGKPIYEREKGIRSSRAIRRQYGLASGNGTVTEIVVSRPDIRIPQFDPLRRMLEKHFELRAIMSDHKRTVVLRDLDSRGKIRREITLEHKAPIGNQVLDKTLKVPGFPATLNLRVSRADVPLSTPAEEGEYADGGLLIMSQHVVLALTLLKFENNEYAARFYGVAKCDYLHDLLKAEEPVLTATRDGINWKHPFTRALKELIEGELHPLVEEERKREQAEERTSISKKLRERLNTALQELNFIATTELGKVTGGVSNNGQNGGKPPFVPANGFGFVPEYVLIQTSKAASLTLRAAIPDSLDAGTLVTVESNSPEVMVLTPQVVIQAREDFSGVGQARVELEGRQVGTEAIITARVNGLKCEALVKVISKKEPSPSSEPEKKKGGLFHDVRFDPRAEPKQRVHFDREKSDIVVATKAPSVAAYFDEAGKGHEEPQGQVLLAELITEAVCREIARRGVENENFLAPAGGHADAIQREYIRLQNQYAHKIHACFVDSEYRRDSSSISERKGRPSRAEMLERAVVAV